MCGLFGIYRESGGIRVHDLTEPLRVLNHRGPDQTGTWLDATGCCALGHTRLSIMDPEGGRQPLFNEDQSVGAVVNGEFYGFEEIRDNLQPLLIILIPYSYQSAYLYFSQKEKNENEQK